MVLSERWRVSDEAIVNIVEALRNAPSGTQQKVVHRSVGPALKRCPQLGLSMLTPLNNHSYHFSNPAEKTSQNAPVDGSQERKPVGGPIVATALRKQDSIPCPLTGRRSRGAPSTEIRIYVYVMSTQDCIALWVDPDLSIGGCGMESTFGEHAEQGGLIAAATSESHRSMLSNVSAVPTELAPVGRRQRVTSLTSSCESSASPTPTPPRRPSKCSTSECQNLQQLIAAFTGIPIESQQLRIGARVIESGDSATLRQKNINHGATVTLLTKHCDGGRGTVFRQVREHAKMNRTEGGAWVMPRWEHPRSKSILEAEVGENLNIEPQFHDYAHLHDVGCFDPCRSIRSHFWSKKGSKSAR